MEEVFAKSRRSSLLEHFSAIKDGRQPCKIMDALPEVLLLVVCATIASCDDYDEIVAWGEAHLGFLRRFLPYHWGIPCEDWLRVVMNRLDPDFFGLLQRLGERVAAAGRRPRRDQACPGEGRGQDLAPQLRPREG